VLTLMLTLVLTPELTPNYVNQYSRLAQVHRLHLNTGRSMVKPSHTW